MHESPHNTICRYQNLHSQRRFPTVLKDAIDRPRVSFNSIITNSSLYHAGATCFCINDREIEQGVSQLKFKAPPVPLVSTSRTKILLASARRSTSNIDFDVSRSSLTVKGLGTATRTTRFLAPFAAARIMYCTAAREQKRRSTHSGTSLPQCRFLLQLQVRSDRSTERIAALQRFRYPEPPQLKTSVASNSNTYSAVNKCTCSF